MISPYTVFAFGVSELFYLILGSAVVAVVVATIIHFILVFLRRFWRIYGFLWGFLLTANIMAVPAFLFYVKVSIDSEAMSEFSPVGGVINLMCMYLLVQSIVVGVMLLTIDFPRTLRFRKVTGRYRLEIGKDGGFYLSKKERFQNKGRVFDGSLDKIAWSDSFIAAKLVASDSGGVNSWMIINLSTDEVDGPVSDDELHRRFPSIKIHSPNRLCRSKWL